jgi:hypothetical protein
VGDSLASSSVPKKPGSIRSGSWSRHVVEPDQLQLLCQFIRDERFRSRTGLFGSRDITLSVTYRYTHCEICPRPSLTWNYSGGW